MDRIVVITGAAGSVGRKFVPHMTGLGWTLRLLDAAPLEGMVRADLTQRGEWEAAFEGADAVIHLAAHTDPQATWAKAVQNIDMTANVLATARRARVRRVVFASSNWVMAGYRFTGQRITPDMAPHPLNPYGVSKLTGERMGRAYAADGGSFIALRIGWNQPNPNVPGPQMKMGGWGQRMWLSDADACQGFQRAVEVEGVEFAVLHLMSDNPGMAWDIEPTRKTIGYAPRDGWTAVLDDQIRSREEMARRSRELAAGLEDQIMTFGW